MKKILVLVFLFVSVGLFADELSIEAQAVRESMPDTYGIIKTRASVEWGSDYAMVVYEINKQAKGLVECAAFMQDDADLFVQCYLKWTDHPDLVTSGEVSCMLAPTDWSMVSWEYKKQASARAAY